MATEGQRDDVGEAIDRDFTDRLVADGQHQGAAKRRASSPTQHQDFANGPWTLRDGEFGILASRELVEAVDASPAGLEVVPASLLAEVERELLHQTMETDDIRGALAEALAERDRLIVAARGARNILRGTPRGDGEETAADFLDGALASVPGEEGK